MKRFTVIVGALSSLVALSPGFVPEPSAKSKMPSIRYRAAQAPTSDTWPLDQDATNLLDVFVYQRDGELETLAGEQDVMCDLIADGSPGTRDNETCTLRVNWSSNAYLGARLFVDIATGLNQSSEPVRFPTPPYDERGPGTFKVKYYVDSQPCSDWIDPDTTYEDFELTIDNDCLDSLDDGFHDISVDVQAGVNDEREDFTFSTAELFLYRGSPHTFSDMVPITGKHCPGYCRDLVNGLYASLNKPSRIVYVDISTLAPRAHPCREDVMGVAWTEIPNESDTYMEEAGPHGNLFNPENMIFKLDSRYPVQARYISNLNPKQGEDHRGLYFGSGATYPHAQMPIRDGGRGVAYVTPDIGGVVNDAGDFYFVEIGGQFREMHRDCSVETIWGWAVSEDEDPVFPLAFNADTASRDAHTALVHENMTYYGDVQEGENSAPYTGAHTPLDVALDPDDDETFYIPAFHDNVIWKVVEGAGAGGQAAVTVWAGDVGHAAGYVDDTGHAARFDGPTSMAYDENCDCWYVSDQNNHRIRKITKGMSGEAIVTTFAGTANAFTRIDDDFTLTGTLTFSTGSSTVVGTGTSFTTELVYESTIVYDGHHVNVREVTDDTHIVLQSILDLSEINAPANASGATVTRLGATWSNSVGLGGYYYQMLARSNAQLQSGTPRYTVNSAQASGGKRPDIQLPHAVRTTSTGDVCTLDLGFGSIRCINPSTFETRHIATLGERLGGADVGVVVSGWAYMDIDKWGNSGPLNGIYYGVFQQGECDKAVHLLHLGTHVNEAFCWAPDTGDPNGVSWTNAGLFVFPYDGSGSPDGWGPVDFTDPPHYYWISVVDPAGGVYFTGGGEHGVSRLRPRTVADPMPSADDTNVEFDWRVPCNVCVTLTNRFGSNGHNFIGMPDLWDYRPDISDADLITAFDIDQTKMDAVNVLKLPRLLTWMRSNMGLPVTLEHDTPGPLKGQLRLRIRGDNTPDHKGGRK